MTGLIVLAPGVACGTGGFKHGFMWWLSRLDFYDCPHPAARFPVRTIMTFMEHDHPSARFAQTAQADLDGYLFNQTNANHLAAAQMNALMQNYQNQPHIMRAGLGQGYQDHRQLYIDFTPSDPTRTGARPQIAALARSGGVAEEYRDDDGKFHRVNGPALVLKNGVVHWFWHGLETVEFVIMNPEKITRDGIVGDTSSPEFIRPMILRYRECDQILHDDQTDGAKLFMRDCIVAGLATEIDHNEQVGTLWHMPLKSGITVAMVEVVNRTQEPSGEYKRFLLRVPATLQSSRAAVAWTWGLTASEYKPGVES